MAHWRFSLFWQGTSHIRDADLMNNRTASLARHEAVQPEHRERGPIISTTPEGQVEQAIGWKVTGLAARTRGQSISVSKRESGRRVGRGLCIHACTYAHMHSPAVLTGRRATTGRQATGNRRQEKGLHQEGMQACMHPCIHSTEKSHGLVDEAGLCRPSKNDGLPLHPMQRYAHGHKRRSEQRDTAQLWRTGTPASRPSPDLMPIGQVALPLPHPKMPSIRRNKVVTVGQGVDDADADDDDGGMRPCSTSSYNGRQPVNTSAADPDANTMYSSVTYLQAAELGMSHSPNP